MIISNWCIKHQTFVKTRFDRPAYFTNISFLNSLVGSSVTTWMPVGFSRMKCCGSLFILGGRTNSLWYNGYLYFLSFSMPSSRSHSKLRPWASRILPPRQMPINCKRGKRSGDAKPWKFNLPLTTDLQSYIPLRVKAGHILITVACLFLIPKGAETMKSRGSSCPIPNR